MRHRHTEELVRRCWGAHTGGHGGLEILRHIGPGLLVTVGFIDPGNWASNMAAGSEFGYALCAPLGRVALDAHAQGRLHPCGHRLARPSCHELLPAYRALVIGFVSLIGLAFLAELALVAVAWPQAAQSWIAPSLPAGSGPIAMSALGAVVMPRSLFLHSEVIQSQHFEGKGEAVMQERLRYEFADTLFSMIVGWAINSTMVILAATTFFQQGIVVDNLAAADTLSPILGPEARLIFAPALLFAGL